MHIAGRTVSLFLRCKDNPSRASGRTSPAPRKGFDFFVAGLDVGTYATNIIKAGTEPHRFSRRRPIRVVRDSYESVFMAKLWCLLASVSPMVSYLILLACIIKPTDASDASLYVQIVILQGKGRKQLSLRGKRSSWPNGMASTLMNFEEVNFKLSKTNCWRWQKNKKEIGIRKMS
ncbi:unnamed protein product [Heligmosomoides polygyrus]|uniref:Uncharacterized protein n=1 Tax=Heligmosomoides polygyrus TaxID=6339 RepID=A0A183FRA2_HELPZ|nr:unnamed protein product [Heligmosomoides polygyrus]